MKVIDRCKVLKTGVMVQVGVWLNPVEQPVYNEILVPTTERGTTYRGVRLKGKMQHFFEKFENQLPRNASSNEVLEKIIEEEQFDHKFLLNRSSIP